MNILINSGYINEKEFANNIIAKNIASELVKLDNKVYIVGTNFNINYSHYETNSYNITTIRVPEFNELLYKSKNKARLAMLNTFSDRIKFILRNPISGLILFLYIFDFTRNIFKNDYVREIKKIILDERIDIIISCVFPFEKTESLVNGINDLKIIYYQLDPYGLNKINNNSVRKELKVMKKVDKIITTNLLFEEYKKHKFYSKLTYKMETLEFPVKPAETLEFDIIKFDKNFINIVYLGTIDLRIRNPKYIFELANKYRNVKLYLIGNIDKSIKSTENIFIFDNIDSKYVGNIISKADILLNIGNMVSNMLPSKLLLYILSKKPILHLQLIENCSSLKYLIKYSNFYIINCENILKDSELECFLEKAKNNEFEYNQFDFTEIQIETIVKKINRIINEQISKNI